MAEAVRFGRGPEHHENVTMAGTPGNKDGFASESLD